MQSILPAASGSAWWADDAKIRSCTELERATNLISWQVYIWLGYTRPKGSPAHVTVLLWSINFSGKGLSVMKRIYWINYPTNELTTYFIRMALLRGSVSDGTGFPSVKPYIHLLQVHSACHSSSGQCKLAIIHQSVPRGKHLITVCDINSVLLP